MTDTNDVRDAVFAAEVRTTGQLPPESIAEVAFAGKSNVGKSTLINCVTARRGLARTSRTPGCTRGLILFDVTWKDGSRTRLVDLPGYGFAARSKDERLQWKSLIERYLATRESLRGVVILVDARRGLGEDESMLLEFLAHAGVRHAIVATKIDQLARPELARAIAELQRDARTDVLAVSGATGHGRDPLVRLVRRWSEAKIRPKIR